MNCSSVDLKAYALGEAGGPGEAAHIESCESCHEELERLRVTYAALLTLKEEEVPRRIAFVSDKIFEPRWWQRIWHSVPAMGFASALVLAAAILVHAYTRPVTNVQQPAAIDSAQVEQRIESEVSQRLDAQVSKAVAKVVAASEARESKLARLLDAAGKRFASERQSDIAMIQQTAQYYRDKIGQIMVASNRNVGDAQ
jgi:hypothetical protein